jgi:hypothetical protein
MVTPDAPVKVVNTAHAMMVQMPSPPGSQPSAAWATRTVRSAVRDSAIMKPARMNSGMVDRIGAVIGPVPTANRVCTPPPKSSEKPRGESMPPNQPSSRNTAKIGTPRASRTRATRTPMPSMLTA